MANLVVVISCAIHGLALRKTHGLETGYRRKTAPSFAYVAYIRGGCSVGCGA